MTGTTALPEDLSPTPDGALGELEPLYEARPLGDVLDDVVAHNKRFIYHADESTHDLIALWVAHSHGLDKWDYSGRLYIHAPVPGVGKSAQAKVIERMTPNGHRTVGTSAPGLFRAIAQSRPTVFLDEADNQFSPTGGRDKADVTAVINGGYEPGNYVRRSVNGVSVPYETYTAMAIVGIDNGTLPEPTQTRCIPVRMSPIPAGVTTERYRWREYAEFDDEIRWQLTNAALDWEWTETPFKMRQADLWEAMWAVAKAAGGEWPERCRIAAERHQWRDVVSQQHRFLMAVRDWFTEHPAETKVQSSVLARWVSSYDDLPTMEGKGVAQRMNGFEVPRAKRSASFYHLSDLQPVFDKWL